MFLDKITQRYLHLFPTDDTYNTTQRQTPDVLLSLVKPVGMPNARLLHFNQKLSEEIGLGRLENQEDIAFLHANLLSDQLKTYATAYAGHQFGNWAGQLGDGRVIFAGEIENSSGKTTEIQWKGAGATPYSRHADGRAVLRSTVREYLMSEAMHHLGIPSTRALSLSLSGESVLRDIMYNGNVKPEQGAIMVRTAESFLRFGHFEFLSSSKNIPTLQTLLNFTIENYYPDIQFDNEKEKYLEWFSQIANRTAMLVVEWYRVGFTHGVMNTDNMSAIGLTIDYGPFGMLDEYQLNFTPNTTDLPGRRYAFGEQGRIAQWNLWKLANAIFPLVNDADALQHILDNFSENFWQKHDEMLCRKFGFQQLKEQDLTFFNEWQNLMQDLKIDYTLFFNQLEKIENTTEEDEVKTLFENVFYKNISDEEWARLKLFIDKYKQRRLQNTFSEDQAKELMKRNNPKFILRNYLLYQCIEELNNNRFDLLHELLQALQSPYKEVYSKFSVKRPAIYNGVAGCSMLSCSS